MKPVMQTKTGQHGNGFSACLASLFECDLTDVPDFFDVVGQDELLWWDAVRDWLRARGFGIVFLDLRAPEHLAVFEGWLMVSGNSEQGQDHVTIWHDGKMIHDPHPDQIGIKRLDGIHLIYPLNPARLTYTADPPLYGGEAAGKMAAAANLPTP